MSVCIYHPDKASIVKASEIPIEDGKHCWHVILWSNLNALQSEMACRGKKCEQRTVGLTCPAPYILAKDGSKRVPRVLGEIHFAKGEWNTEVVAHEVMHATANFLLIHEELLQELEEIDPQERVCYMHGRLFDAVYRFLWEADPYPLPENRITA